MLRQKRVVRLSPKLLSDPVLGGVVSVFVAIDFLVCIIWVSIDPLKSTTTSTIQVPSGDDLPTVHITVACESKWLIIYWVQMCDHSNCLCPGNIHTHQKLRQ